MKYETLYRRLGEINKSYLYFSHFMSETKARRLQYYVAEVDI